MFTSETEFPLLPFIATPCTEQNYCCSCSSQSVSQWVSLKHNAFQNYLPFIPVKWKLAVLHAAVTVCRISLVLFVPPFIRSNQPTAVSSKTSFKLEKKTTISQNCWPSEKALPRLKLSGTNRFPFYFFATTDFSPETFRSEKPNHRSSRLLSWRGCWCWCSLISSLQQLAAAHRVKEGVSMNIEKLALSCTPAACFQTGTG